MKMAVEPFIFFFLFLFSSPLFFLAFINLVLSFGEWRFLLLPGTVCSLIQFLHVCLYFLQLKKKSNGWVQRENRTYTCIKFWIPQILRLFQANDLRGVAVSWWPLSLAVTSVSDLMGPGHTEFVLHSQMLSCHSWGEVRCWRHLWSSPSNSQDGNSRRCLWFILVQ